MKSYHDGRVQVWTGDCLEIMKALPPDSVDACVTDPPYHFASIVKRFSKASLSDDTLTSERARRNSPDAYARSSRGFMGKEWDGGQIAHDPATWAAVLRVLKPGAHLLAFHAPKNWHRLACAIEDAGFEIRDNILWLFGSGFPKSHNIGLAVDKLNGAGPRARSFNFKGRGDRADEFETNGREPLGAYEAENEWGGYGTALKPAYEPIVLARKPLAKGQTIAGNVQAHGTGAINIDGCRVDAEPWKRPGSNAINGDFANDEPRTNDKGRWPANVVHDGSAEVLAGFPDALSHFCENPSDAKQRRNSMGNFSDGLRGARGHDDSGSAARFFYTAKADADDRIGSKHPTVKPLDLMQWLVRLVTPPRGLILDPFAGTGSTAEAALREGFASILIEREAEYLVDIERRLAMAYEGDMSRSVAMAKLRDEGEPLPLFAGLK